MPLSRTPAMMLEEACLLVEAIGLEVSFSEVVSFARPRAASFLGKGHVERLAALADEVDHPLIVVNTALTVQQRNLETITNTKVIDRTALILGNLWRAGADTCWSPAGRACGALLPAQPSCAQLDPLERQRGGVCLRRSRRAADRT